MAGSTPQERTILIRQESRLVYVDVDTISTSSSRTVRVRAQDRTVRINRKPNAADRTVLVNED